VKRLLKATQGYLLLCQSTLHNDFLAQLNLFFYRSWDITPPVCTSVHHLSSRWNWKRLRVGGHALVCRGAQNVGISNHKLTSALRCTVWSQSTPIPDRQTDRQTDGRTSCQ